MYKLNKKYLLFLLPLSSLVIKAMEPTTPEDLLQFLQSNHTVSYINKHSLMSTNDNRETVLHLACKQGDIESIITIYFAAKQDMKTLMFAHNDNNYLPLHVAAANNDVTVIDVLLQMYINLGKSPWSLISYQNDLVRSTALHVAAESGHANVVKTLIQCAESHLLPFIFMKKPDKRTALHCAAINGHAEIVKILMQAAADSAQKLANAHDEKGLTAMHLAVLNNQIDVIKAFSQVADDNALNLNIKSQYGSTPFGLAKLRHYTEIIALLEEVNCSLCLETKNAANFHIMDGCNTQDNILSGCKYSFCKKCLLEHVTVHLDEGSTHELKCPNINCAQKMDQSDIYTITQNHKPLYNRFLDISFSEFQMQNQNYIKLCPMPDCACSYSIDDIDDGDEPQRIRCPGCHNIYCILCQFDHPNMTCEDAVTMKHNCLDCGTRHASFVSCEAAARDRVQTESFLTESRSLEWHQQQVKTCPHCKVFIQKNKGCNHMTCQMCGHQFCWTCLAPYGTTQCDPAGCAVLDIETGINF